MSHFIYCSNPFQIVFSLLFWYMPDLLLKYMYLVWYFFLLYTIYLDFWLDFSNIAIFVWSYFILLYWAAQQSTWLKFLSYVCLF